MTSLSPLRVGLIAVGVIALVAVVVLLNRNDVQDGQRVLVGDVPAVEVEHDGVRFLLTDRDGGEFCTYGWDLYAEIPEAGIELAPTIKALPLPGVEEVYVEAYILDAPGLERAAGTIVCDVP